MSTARQRASRVPTATHHAPVKFQFSHHDGPLPTPPQKPFPQRRKASTTIAASLTSLLLAYGCSVRSARPVEHFPQPVLTATAGAVPTGASRSIVDSQVVETGLTEVPFQPESHHGDTEEEPGPGPLAEPFSHRDAARNAGDRDSSLGKLGMAKLVGHVTDGDGRPMPGIPLQWTANGTVEEPSIEATVGVDGYYAVAVPLEWEGTAQLGPDHRLDRISAGTVHITDRLMEIDLIVHRNYYVSPQGSDGGPGGLHTPFRTIQEAASRAGPGDTIYLRGGRYDLSNDPAYRLHVIAFRSSGEPGRPITLEAFGDEDVTISTRESKPVFDFTDIWNHATGGFGHFVFRKLHITGGRYGWMFRPPAPQGWSPGSGTLDDLLAAQIHDILIEDCEVDGRGGMEAAIYARNAGVRDLTVRRCSFHHTIGTEGTVDIGEWGDAHPAHAIPRSASRGLLFEDCQFHQSQHQQSSGIVFQPCVYDVTLRRCTAWNNGKYGFACKGSGSFRLDRCAAWGNDSTQMYCRGFGGDSGAARTSHPNDFLITNCVFIAPADQRGGAALNWRENASLRIYHCTLVGLRDTAHQSAGGFALQLGHHHLLPSTAIMVNSIVAGYCDAPAVRFHAPGGVAFLINTRYEAASNLFYSEAATKFRVQALNMTAFEEWQAYWRRGQRDGDDAANGPRATDADAASIFSAPGFHRAESRRAPLRKHWPDDFLGSEMDVRIVPSSPAAGLGKNLSELGISELGVDYLGHSRPIEGPWTAGAFEPSFPSAIDAPRNSAEP